MKILMTGVDKNRLGGMWTVANNYISSKEYNSKVDLTYIATSTNGSIIKRTILMLVAFIKIFIHLSKKDTDLVHIHMAEKGSTFRARIITKIAKRYGTKVIIHLHAGPFIDWYSSLNEKKKNQIIELFNLCDRVLVLGEYWKKSLSSIVEINKIRVLYNGVTIPEKNKYNVNGKYITFMGVLKKEKGIYDLIDAIEIINEKLEQSIKVKLCGIDLEGNIQDYINKKGLTERFELEGWVNENNKNNIMKNTLISILPSYYEGLSMTVIESISYGIPIITTSISTMPEILGNYEYLIPPGNVNMLANNILDLINSKDELKKISNYEFKRALTLFSDKDFIKNTLIIYNEVVEEV